MLKKMMFEGLFKRLLAAGHDPISAGEPASANYPHAEYSPETARDPNLRGQLSHGTVRRPPSVESTRRVGASPEG